MSEALSREAPVYTAELVERGYNLRAAFPEHPRYFALYAEMSQAAVAALAPRLDLRYGPGPKETLDLFVPATRPRGTFVFIHGGYWRAFDKSDFSFVASPFVAQGLAVAVVNYDLCPDVSIAQIVDECRRALSWIAGEGTPHGAHPGRIVVGGHSAGGHLTAMLFATDWAREGVAVPSIAGGVSLSGVHDLVPMVQFSYNTDLKLDRTEAARLSPVLLAPRTRAPIVLAAGADETTEFVRQTRIMWDAWPHNRPAGAAGPMLIAGRNHFDVVVDFADPASDLVRATLALF